MTARSLDVQYAQVLVEFPRDRNGFYWHHRVLLRRITEARWVTLTPDDEVVLHDLAAMSHQVLGRRAPFPAWAAGQLYAFDEDQRTDASLAAFLPEAALQAGVLDGAPVLPEADGGPVWFVAEVEDVLFGQPVDERSVDDPASFVALGDRGLLRVNGRTLSCGRCPPAELEQRKKDLRDGHVDVRVLGDFRDDNGRRALDFGRSIGYLKNLPMPSWSFVGPKVVAEFLQNVLDGPGNLVSYHSEWVRLSGVAPTSSQCHEHRHLCETVRLALGVDQLDVSCLACVEQTVRRLVQIEMAVDRSPQHPDFTGLDVLTDGSVTRRGAARAPVFAQWVSDKQKERSTMLKNQRLYSGEICGRRRKGDKDDEDDDESGGGKGRRRRGAGAKAAAKTETVKK